MDPEFTFRLRTYDVKMGEHEPISFKATVQVQQFIDQTLRVQIHQPEFSGILHKILEITGNANSSESLIELLPKIEEKITEPFLVHLNPNIFPCIDDYFLRNLCRRLRHDSLIFCAFHRNC